MFINTPAQFHFYRNIAKKLEENGNQIIILFRNYGETLALAREYGLDAFVFAEKAKSPYEKLVSFPMDLIRAVKKLRQFKPDVVTGFGLYEGYSSLFVVSNSIVFTDSEPRSHRLLRLQYALFKPLTDVIITPSTFRDYLGEKHIRIDSYKELAYLHPNYYKPNDDIFEYLGISKGEEYAVLRFNAFDAVHDLQVSGFNPDQKVRLVKSLSNYARIFVSGEGKIPNGIKDHVLKTPKSRIHDVLYYAKLLVTDTQTMATEAALLGTPTIRSNNFVDLKREMGNFIELEKRYGLLFNIRDREAAISLAEELANRKGLKDEWRAKRELLLKEKIDVSSFMVWFIENFPESYSIIKLDPEVQYNFV
ncbi:MAG: DUF354 domain-containing protein [Anaerolineae bacterium]